MNSQILKIEDLSDQQLLTATEKAVTRERESTLSVLQHLHEVERRRLFATLGCSSLFTYCTEKLGYSESAAQRRIVCMRALKELPQLAAKIQSGQLSLTVVANAQSVLCHEKRNGNCISNEQRRALFQELEGKSRREADLILAKVSSDNPLPPAEVKVLKDGCLLFSIVVDQGFEQKLARLKGLLAHRSEYRNSQSVLDFALDTTLARLTPKKPVWLSASSKCVLCHSTHALQVDHVLPRAQGGGNEHSNLRLLCRTCNQRQAIEKIGLEKMQRFI